MPEIKDNSAGDNLPEGESVPKNGTAGQAAGVEKTPAEKPPATKTPAEKLDAEKTPAVPAASVEKTPAEKTPVEKTPAKPAATGGRKPMRGEKTGRGRKPGPKASERSSAPTDTPAASGAKGAAVKRVRGTKAKVRRRWPAVLAGAATLALAVGVVGAGTLYPGANATTETTPEPHPLPVGETMANCQGPTQLLAGSDAGADPEFSASPSDTKTLLNAVVLSGSTGEVPGAAVQSLDGKSSPLFTVSDAPSAPVASPSAITGKPKDKAVVVRGKTADAPSVLRLQPLAEEYSQGSGSVVVNAEDGDLAGLAAATCQTPANEMWLSGASTTVGRTAVLSIANSSQSAATVSLEFFSGNGPLQAPAGKGLVVDAGTVRSVVLSGLAPDQDLLSVHLKSAGGAVSATIQQSVLRGLTPGGVDYLAPVQAPASTLTIPGVRVQKPSDAAKITAQSGYADAATALAVTVPGVRDSVVEVKAYGSEGQVALPNGGVFTATAGKVSELSLAGLPQGTYSLSVSADEPVAGTVRLVNSTKTGEAVDMAYVPSTERLGNNHLVSVPQNATTNLVFSAPNGAATVNLVPITESGVLGKAKDIELKAGITASVNPADLLGSGTAAVLVSVSGEPTYGTQLLGNNDSANIAVLPIAATTAGSQAINIRTGY